MDYDLHRVGISGHHLVDTIIDNFINQVMQAALVGSANVHARTHPNCLKTFENLNILLTIIAIAVAVPFTTAITIAVAVPYAVFSSIE